jgi:hypothetical protein
LEDNGEYQNREIPMAMIKLKDIITEVFQQEYSRGIPKIDDSVIGMDIRIGDERYVATLNTIPGEGKYRIGGVYVNQAGEEEAFTHVNGNTWESVLRHLPTHFIYGADVITYRKRV